MNILIADDNPTNLKLLRATLEAEHHQVLAASDGAEALDLLRAHPVAAIISDILMPNMDGYRFCHEVRHSEAWKNIPFVFYTNTYTSPADEKLALAFGADKFLRKPATSAVLVETLREVTALPQSRSCAAAPVEDLLLMKQYSERLVAKLEEKNVAFQQRWEELQDSHALLHAIVEGTTDPIFVKDVQGRYLMVNTVAAGILQKPVSEILGHDDTEFLSPEAAAEVMANDRRVFATGQPLVLEETVPVDGRPRQFLSTKTALRDARGNVTGVIGLARDITARKKLEQELASREERLNAFFTGATAGLALLDADLRFIRINETLAAMNGMTVNAIVGMTVDEIIPNLAPTVVPMLRHVFTTGEPVLNAEVTGETENQPKIQRHWMASFFPIAVTDGKPDAIGAIVVEITDRKRAEEELRRFNRAAVGRELRMMELKRQINELCRELNREAVYKMSGSQGEVQA